MGLFLSKTSKRGNRRATDRLASLQRLLVLAAAGTAAVRASTNFKHESAATVVA